MSSIRSRSAPSFPPASRTAPARRPRVLVVAAALGVALCVAACTDQPTAPADLSMPSADLVDGAHGTNGNAHFYFLKPLVTPPASFPGTFDPTQAPTVEICQWDADATTPACVGANVAEFSTTTGSGSEIIRIDPDVEQYIVDWHTDESNLDATKVYRIRVLIGPYELGHADLDPVTSGRELKNVNTGEYIALKDGRTLPIKFRIEQGAIPDVQPLAAGGLHTCALSSTGATYCWGYNQQGELGSGTAGGATASPQTVTGNHTFSAVASGRYFSCALTPAGAAWCWGDNRNGELGTGTIGGSSPAPVAVAGGHVFTAISAGDSHACGLTSAGTTWCWGGNLYGQLGIGSATFYGNPTPTAVPGVSFRTLSAGGSHTCGITTAGVAECWGGNSSGQLGIGTTTAYPEVISTPTPVSTTERFVSLSAGVDYTCALDDTGQAWCWGANSYGKLGRTTFGTLEPTPVPVSGSQTFAAITAGPDHACGLTSAGTAWCWGRNEHGEIGTGSVTELYPKGIDTPTEVPGVMFRTLSAGGSHTCGITTAGAAECWGNNTAGQLGTGSFSTNYPYAIPNPTQVTGSLTFLTH